MRVWMILCFVLAIVLTIWTPPTWSCKEALCGSLVSKCLLTQSCKCELKNCTCCKDCFICLGELYSDCCSCVEMCPKSNDSDTQLKKNSHVEDLSDDFPELFSALTQDPDSLLRWTSYTFPAHIGISFYKEFIYTTGYSSKEGYEKIKEKELSEINCTVAYLSQCMSWNKCKSSCTSMGASSYRWFHDGCCECVGQHCLNYGINESRCKECPNDVEDKAIEDYEEVLDNDDVTVMEETSEKYFEVSATSEEYSEAKV